MVRYGRSASVRKLITTCVPETIGLEMPMKPVFVCVFMLVVK